MNRRNRRIAQRLASGAASLTLAEQLAVLGLAPTYDDAFTPEQAAPIALARVEWQRKRAAIIAAHTKRSRINDVGMMQELHSPTVEISTDDPAEKKRARANVTRVRQSEAWRHNNLSAMERQAESEMQLAWQNRTQGLGVSASNINGIRSGPASTDPAQQDERQAERYADLDATWREFVRATQRERVAFGLVLRVLVEPRTLAQIEHDFRLRPGVAFAEYCRGLNLWCVLRGWIRRNL